MSANQLICSGFSLERGLNPHEFSPESALFQCETKDYDHFGARKGIAFSHLKKASLPSTHSVLNEQAKKAKAIGLWLAIQVMAQYLLEISYENNVFPRK